MLMLFRKRRPAIRTLRGWAIASGSRRDPRVRAARLVDGPRRPHARERAFDIARRDPPPGVSPQAAAVAIAEVLDGIGDACPECPAH
jgi:hypothetical protein